MRKFYIFSFLLFALTACGVQRDLHLVGTPPDTPPPHRHMPRGVAKSAGSGSPTTGDPSGMGVYGVNPQYVPYGF